MTALIRSPSIFASLLLLMVIAGLLLFSGTAPHGPWWYATGRLPGWSGEGRLDAIVPGKVLDAAKNNNEDNGLYLRTRSVPGTTYRLRVEGAAGAGHPLLRIRLDDVDMGVLGTPLTHVTTVVAAEDGRFYVFDPTLNGIYTGPSGSIVDLETVLLHDTSEGTLFHTRLIKRTILDVASAPDGIEAVLAEQLEVHNPDCASVDGEYVRCVRIPYDVRYLRYGWAVDLRNYHLAENSDPIVALMRRAVLRISHTAGEDVRQGFIAMLNRVGVPVQTQ